MRTRKSHKRLWTLLIVLAMLVVVGQRVSIDEGRIGWRSFGQPRHSFAHSDCGIPIHSVLGEVDSRFGFDRQTVSRAMTEATGLWQASAEAPLFVTSDHPRTMLVSLKFDERQRSANLRRSLRGGIDANRAQLKSDEASLKRAARQIEAARRADERESALLAARMRGHEAEVAAWNQGSAGARTQARGLALEREKLEIRAALLELERARQDFNREVAAYNQRADDRRQQTEQFQGRIAQYNAHASEEPIESGRYSYEREQGRRIEVFRAADYNELVWILAHEFGHALGLEHVEAPGAVMHALLHEGGQGQQGRTRPLDLDAADRAAIVSLCGERLRERS